MDTANYMESDPRWPDDWYYNGPDVWVEGDEKLVACAITWDDMWLTKGEITRMMDNIAEEVLTKTRGAVWQQMRIVWRDNIQHFVLEVPLYDA